uniref:DNA pilot protein n=1 Tax=Dulem virus 204 TaxID=3145681 RepID=A0AAU8BAM8_9VIRU
MSALAGIGSIISGIGSIGIGAANAYLTDKANKKNLEFQRETLNYQKQLQREIFQREDNAIQRRANDILAAGGNPALAYAGDGAGAGQSVDTITPQTQSPDLSLMQSSLSQFQNGLAQFKQNQLTDATISKLHSDESLNDATVKVRLAEELLTMERTAATRAEKLLLHAKRKELLYNIDVSKHVGSKTTENSPTILTGIKDVLSQYDDAQIDGLSMADLGKLAIEAGLFLLPGMGFLKAGNFIGKGVRAALKLFKNTSNIEKITNIMSAYEKTLLGSKSKFRTLGEFEYWKVQQMNKKFNEVINDFVSKSFK